MWTGEGGGLNTLVRHLINCQGVINGACVSPELCSSEWIMWLEIFQLSNLHIRNLLYNLEVMTNQLIGLWFLGNQYATLFKS